MQIDLEQEIRDRKAQILKLKEEIKTIQAAIDVCGDGIDMGDEPESDEQHDVMPTAPEDV